MEHNENYDNNKGVFIFESSNPEVVKISISAIGKDRITDDASDILRDLSENLDQNFRSGGFMYDIKLTHDNQMIEIKPFEDGDAFNQEIFNLIAEELEFMDTLITTDDQETMNLD